MAKKGSTKHLKRIAAPKTIFLTNRKKDLWLLKSSPGAHKSSASLPLAVLLRETLDVAKTMREVKNILNARAVEVDGRVRTSPAYAVGLMDIIHFKPSGRYYRIMVDNKARLAIEEISKNNTQFKYLKVVGKTTVKNGKFNIAFHDGTNMLGDNQIKVGDTVMIAAADRKMKNVLKLENGARCLITEGKHAGTIATLKETIVRAGGKDNEARLEYTAGEFITVAKYLFVVDDTYGPKGAS